MGHAQDGSTPGWEHPVRSYGLGDLFGVWSQKEGKWNLPAASSCPSLLPKAHRIFYRYYHTLFTHSLPKALRTIADEIPICVDVLMNFLVATVTKLPPIKVPYGRQHPEASPVVRLRHQGLVHTGKARDGWKEKRGRSLFPL